MITNRELDVIALRRLGSAPTLPPNDTLDDHAASFELVRDAPPNRDGWSLRCRRGGRVQWSMPLAPRGAAPRVRPAVAQAVAVRVLSEQGVFVSGWNSAADSAAAAGPAAAGPDDGAHFVARTPRGASVLHA